MKYNTTNHSFIASKLLLITILASFNAHAAMQPIKTAWLKSTGGAGVAAILLDEATVLNPAPIGFFETSAAYFSQTEGKSTVEDGANLTQPKDTTGMNIILSDTQQKVNGSFNYATQEYNDDTREMLAVSSGALIGKKSSLGFTYKYIKDEFYEGGVKVEDEYSQYTVGVLHILNEYASFGIVCDNPIESSKKDTLGLTGAKITYKDMATLMFDVGGNFYEGLSETFLYRTGVELKIYSDFLLRFGMFNDNGRHESGSGFGLSWVSPRLILTFAINTVNVKEDRDLNQIEEKLKETSFAASIHF